eukprot:Skav207862  [mRNA]  locus=scaffold1988:97176:105141:+ [translate_table: standard]
MVKDAMGRVYIVMDKPDKAPAIEAVDQAREIADKLGDKRWSARTPQHLKLLFGVAQAHMKAKDWRDTNEAIETLDKTIGLAQAAGDMQDRSLPPNVVWKYGNMRIFEAEMNPKAALRVAKEARTMAQKNGDKRAQSGDLDAALECAEERLAVLRGIHDLSMEAALPLRVQVDALLLFTQLNNTKVLDKPEDCRDKSMKPIIDRAVRTVNEALQVAGKAENRSLRALVLFKRAENLGMVVAQIQEMDHYQALGQAEEGEADVQKADSIAQETGDHQLADEAQGNAGQRRATQGNAGQRRATNQCLTLQGLDPIYVRKQLAAMVKEFQMALSPSLVFDFPTLRRKREVMRG